MRHELDQLHHRHPQSAPTQQRQAMGGETARRWYVMPPGFEEQQTPHQSPHGAGIGDE
jgi:hypothetical protein